jgi:hypothetical protein
MSMRGHSAQRRITGDDATIFRHALPDGPRRHRLEAHRLPVRNRPDRGHG